MDDSLPANRERESGRAGGIVAVLSRAFNTHGRQGGPLLHEPSPLLIGYAF